MVPGAATTNPTEQTTTDDDSSTAFNALVGGIAGVVLSFVPLSTLLGGVIAGYLDGGTTADGLRVGAYAGLVMLLPIVLIGAFLLFFLGIGGAPSAFGVLAVIGLLAAAVYTVGLGALGGVLGVYLDDEF